MEIQENGNILHRSARRQSDALCALLMYTVGDARCGGEPAGVFPASVDPSHSAHRM
jgi:hypothetical protein